MFYALFNFFKAREISAPWLVEWCRNGRFDWLMFWNFLELRYSLHEAQINGRKRTTKMASNRYKMKAYSEASAKEFRFLLKDSESKSPLLMLFNTYLNHFSFFSGFSSIETWSIWHRNFVDVLEENLADILSLNVWMCSQVFDIREILCCGLDLSDMKWFIEQYKKIFKVRKNNFWPSSNFYFERLNKDF